MRRSGIGSKISHRFRTRRFGPKNGEPTTPNTQPYTNTQGHSSSSINPTAVNSASEDSGQPRTHRIGEATKQTTYKVP